MRNGVLFLLLIVLLLSEPLVSTTVNTIQAMPPIDIETKRTIQVAIASWNLAESTPHVSDCRFIRKLQDSDLVILGVQECEDLLPRVAEGRLSQAWSVLQKYALGPEFLRLKKLRMGGIQMSVFAKKKLASDVQNIQSVCVPCGVGNIMANKGAVCTVLTVCNATIAAVNVHLAAHESAVLRRNADYLRIRDVVATRISLQRFKHNNLNDVSIHPARYHKHMPFRSKSRLINRKYKYKTDASESIDGPANHPRSIAESVLNMDRSTLDQTIDEAYRVSRRNQKEIKNMKKWPFDATFFFGDLNYRIRYPAGRKAIQLRKDLSHLAVAESKAVQLKTNLSDDNMTTKQRVISELLKYDQLRSEMKRRNSKVLSGFHEMAITFLPTYKYDRRSHKFDSSTKKRRPSYTDRILFATRKAGTTSSDSSSEAVDYDNLVSDKISVLPLEYFSDVSCTHSDHRPVCAKFQLRI